MIKALRYGIRKGVEHWRAGLIVYALLLCLGLTIGIQVYHVLEASIGNSMELEKLIKQYDHTVIRDFLKVHGASVTPLVGQLRWYLLIFLIFSIFINAGLMHCVISNEPRKDWMHFWTGGAKYFYAFLKIGIFFLLMFLFWTGIIALPASMYIGKIFNTAATEMPMYYVIGVSVILVLFYWLVLISWSINTKLTYLHNDVKIWAAIKQGFRLTVKRFIASPRFLMLFILFQLVIVFIHLYLEGVFGMTSGLLILIFFITQQLLVFFRILWRLMVYEGFDNYNFEKSNINT